MDSELDIEPSKAQRSRRQRRELRLQQQQQQHLEEIELLQQAKQREIDMAGNPEWREHLRLELEAEISRRVREALDTPPAERQRRQRELARVRAAEQRELELSQLRSAAAAAAVAAAPAPVGAPRFCVADDRRPPLDPQLPETDDFDYWSGTDFALRGPATVASSRFVRFQESSDSDSRNRRQFRPLVQLQQPRRNVDNLDEGFDDFGGDDVDALPMISASGQLTGTGAALWTSPQQRQRRNSSTSDVTSGQPLRQGLEAMRHFGDLTIDERILLFRNFTRDGFRQACSGGGGGAGVGCIIGGRLPDGSVLTRQADGRYRDQYGLVRDSHGPFWPRDFGPCHPTPRHRRLPSPEFEPLLLPLRNPGCEPLLTVDNQTTQYTGRWRGVQIVYDSEKCPRHYTPSPVSEGLSPSLVFESRFESGNLRQARRVGMFEYELVLRTDLYTKRHTQWFYFKVHNAQPQIVYKFVILNLLKPTSLYGEGMKPLLYSEKLAATDSVGWHRRGHHIRYSRNVTRLQSALLHRDMVYYQLEWQMEFPHPEDSCYVAHSYPYTYSDLRADLIALQSDQSRSRFIKEEVLCQTRAGNSCFLLTVTDESDAESRRNSHSKPGVVVTARVHPGESNSSWMMKGLVDFLTGDSATACCLRKHFVFKLVPMLNPDGVIVGNYRTSLAARDLNRNYRHPRPEAFPTVYHTKRMLERLQQERPVILYCDLHGHSRKSNVFMYGCDSQYRGVDADQVNSVRLKINPEGFLKERLFPWLVSRCSPQLFSYRGCKFNIRKCKEATGRVVMWRQFGIENSFTMEATFSGTSASMSDCRHFNTNDLESMGHSLASALWQYKQVKEDSVRQCSLVIDMTLHLLLGLMGDKGLSCDSFLPSATEPKRQDDEDATPESKKDKPALIETLRLAISGGGKAPAAKRSLGRINSSQLMELLALKSMDDCSSVIRQLNIVNADESDSSDSDSESEPEMAPLPPQDSMKKRKRKVKKKDSSGGIGKKRDAKEFEAGRENDPNSMGALSDQMQANGSKLQGGGVSATTDDASNNSARVKIKQYPLFVSKFEGRTNKGIPCFSEERLLERANRKIFSLHSRLNQEQGRDIIYSHMDEIPSEHNPGLASLEEIRYRLQHLLASQDEDADSGDSNASNENTHQDIRADEQQRQQQQQPRQQLQPDNQSFVVVRPVQSLRPSKILQRRRSLSHFGGRPGAHPPLAAASLSPPHLDQSLPTQLVQLKPHQITDGAVGSRNSAQPDSATTATAASTAPTNHSRARAHRLPQLRERHS
ncbi:hypothetical protein BOX15_Mlig032425g2 [Macrostomum lignano]|uniref:Peptidase M14 domain-containing protein n=1 Tax=Macrostomum lignano TaxID=282301 RepID=A0A267H055_9PLAT|nr:hypothetical protein BOX15_Mlig032425g2 [Macrostomum lignano]